MGSFQLNLHHIISFYCVAKEQSFSGAAERLAITQPAVTQHIRSLEVQFGIKLINVKKKRLSLTKAGERLLAYAEELYGHAVVIENFLKTYRFNNITIGIGTQLMVYFTGLIDHFKELYPSIKVSIREGTSIPLAEELLDYKHDICLIGMVSPYDKRIQVYRIKTDEQMVFVTSSKYPLPFNRPIKWAELTSHPLIIQSEGSAARSIVLHQFEKRGLTPMIGAEVSNIALAKELTRQNKGLALMFEPNIKEELASGIFKTVQIEDDEIKVGAIDILVNRGERFSPAVESFLLMLKEHFHDNFREVPPE